LNELNNTNDELCVDQTIDDVTTRRQSGRTSGPTSALPGAGPAATPLSSDEALIVQLSRLDGIDWLADEIGDRIAMSVAAAARQHAAPAPAPAREHVASAPAHQHAGPAPAPAGSAAAAGPASALMPAAATPDRRQLAAAQPPRSPRPQRSHIQRRTRWFAAAAVAAAIAVILGAIQLTGGSHATGGHTAGHITPARKSAPGTHPKTKDNGPTHASLTAMTIVTRTRVLQAVGVVAYGNIFLTCVTRSICYVEGSHDNDKRFDLARTVNGGVTWTAGEELPKFSFQWDAALSCPTPQKCFSGFGTELLVTTDGFAHYRLQPVTLPPGMTGRLYAVGQVSCPTMRHCVANVTMTNSTQALIYSGNGGLTWAEARTPNFGRNGNYVGQIRCARDGACIAAIMGGDAEYATVTVLSSSDGGRSWIMSAAHAIPSLPTWTISCGDARNCLIGGGDYNDLVWMHVTDSGRTSIRIEAFPKRWATTGVTVSCATGLDCFVETDGSLVTSYPAAMIESTRDGGLTWTSTPMAPSAQQDIAAFLSCPVPAGCIGVANDPTSSHNTWVVLSNLRH
jgi:hypothetical protein